MSAKGRAALLAALMLGASLLAVAMRPREFIADRLGRPGLARLVPERFGAWELDRTLLPVPPSPDLQRIIDATYDETLARTYRDAEGHRVMLSVAYGRNQHKGMNTHRPEICYPAQGFRLATPTTAGALSFEGRAFTVQRLVAEADARSEPITYWLTVGEHVTAFGYAQRWATIRYGLRGQVPDGVLVRVSSIDGDAAQAWRVHERFIQALLAALDPGQRARFIGGAAP